MLWSFTTSMWIRKLLPFFGANIQRLAPSDNTERLVVAKFLLFAAVAGIHNVALSQTGAEFSITARPYPARPGAPVTFQVTGANLPLQVDFGDEVVSTISTSTFQHSYSRVGHFKVVIQSRDSEGGLVIKQQVVTVTTATPSPTSSSASNTIARDPINRKLWVVNSDNDSVTRMDPVSGAREMEVDLGDGCHPTSVATDATANVWVVCHKSDTIKILSSQGGLRRTIELPYGSAPFGIAPNPGGTIIYATTYGKGALTSYNTTTFAEISSIILGPTARAIAVSNNGARVLVTRFISVGNQGELWDVASDQGLLRLSKVIPLVEDTVSPETTQSGRGVPNYLAGVAIHPSGTYAWVTAKKDNSNRGVFLNGTDLNQENAVRSIVMEVDLSSGLETFARRRDIDNSDSPNSIAFSPLGDYAFVAIQGTQGIVVYDLLGSNAAITSGVTPFLLRISTGIAPQGVLFDSTTYRLLVQNFLSRSVSFINMAAFMAGSSSTLRAQNINSSTREKLSPTVLRGKQIFYTASDAAGPSGRNKMSGEGYFSCATCHIDGGHDGRTWDFTGRGEGLRNTTDMRGRGGTDHGRVHWTANFDEIQDFENDIRTHFGGSGFMSDQDFAATSATLGARKTGRSADLDALAAYVSSLDIKSVPRSPFRAENGALTAAGVRGAAIFARVNCQSCHSGAKLTDSSLDTVRLHNIGTLTQASGKRLNGPLAGIDTPTLLGVWSAPPYLHDGRAQRILEVFAESAAGVGEADAHRVVLSLSPTEQQDLAAFLLQIDGSPMNLGDGASNASPTPLDPTTGNQTQEQIRALELLFNKVVTILRTAEARGQLTSELLNSGVRILRSIIARILELQNQGSAEMRQIKRLAAATQRYFRAASRLSHRDEQRRHLHRARVQVKRARNLLRQIAAS